MTPHRLHRLAFAAATALALSVISPAGAGAVAAPVECIAHRGGATTHTEETEPTYEAALDAGVPEVEGDIRWTSTGYPYMLHDATLGLFGHSSVAISSVSGTTLGGATYVSTSGDHIESLYALRQQILAHPGSKLQAELKTVLTSAQWTMLATRLDPIKDVTTITSFDPDTIQEAQIRGYRTGFLASTFSETTEAPIYAQDFSTIEPDDVDIHNRRGVTTQAWTPDTVSAWNDLRSAGVSAIITNKPLDCMTWSAAPLSRKKRS
jgi:glycerophosphoryl diester phosphodiesterase